MIKFLKILTLALLIHPFPPIIQAQELITEQDYVNYYCQGQIEYLLWDLTRVDCLTEEEAQEYDWGKKSYEAIGQSLWYAANTGKRAAIVLIIKEAADEKGLLRARRTIAHYNLPITIHIIRP